MLKLKLQNFGHLMWKEPTHWKRPWCWERLRAGGEGDDRGWDGWMASLTQWTWVWANTRRCWRTGKPGMLQSMGRKESDTTERLNNNNNNNNKLKQSLHLINTKENGCVSQSSVALYRSTTAQTTLQNESLRVSSVLAEVGGFSHCAPRVLTRVSTWNC